MQIYNYYSGTVTCSYWNKDNTYVWTGVTSSHWVPRDSQSCVPSTVYASARCHLLHNTGPVTGWCDASYETVG